MFSQKPRALAALCFLIVLDGLMYGCATKPTAWETLERIEQSVRSELPIGADETQIEAASKKLGILFQYDKIFHRYTGSVDNVARSVLGSASVRIVIELDSSMRVTCIDTEIVGPAAF